MPLLSVAAFSSIQSNRGSYRCEPARSRPHGLIDAEERVEPRGVAVNATPRNSPCHLGVVVKFRPNCSYLLSMRRTLLICFGAASALVIAAAVAQGASPGQIVEVRDRRGDVKSPDLDLLAASLGRNNGRLTARLTTRTPIGSDVIFSVFISTARAGYQLSAKRTTDETTFFVFRAYPNPRQYNATGFFKERQVTITAPASRAEVNTNAFRFYFSAEGTNDRPPHVDRVPNDERPALEQIKTPLARSFKFPQAP